MYIMIGYALICLAMGMCLASDDEIEQIYARTKLELSYAGKWDELQKIGRTYKEYQLLRASCVGDWSKVKAIIERHRRNISLDIADDEGIFPLWCAVQSQNHEIIHFLLEQKADPNRTFQSKRRNVIALRYNGSTALFEAAYQGDVKAASLLLDYGASPHVYNKIGSSPLFAAVQASSLPMMRLLLEREINVNVQEKVVCIIDNDPVSAVGGDTPLIFAAAKNDLNMVRLLLNAGANNVESKNVFGKTARLLASLHGNAEMFHFLTNATSEKYDEPAAVVVSFVRSECNTLFWID